MKKIIKFEKTDCNPCLMVSRFLVEQNVSFEAINPFDNPEMAVRHRVRSVPTTILLNEEHEMMRSIGFRPEELRSMIDAL